MIKHIEIFILLSFISLSCCGSKEYKLFLPEDSYGTYMIIVDREQVLKSNQYDNTGIIDFRRDRIIIINDEDFDLGSIYYRNVDENKVYRKKDVIGFNPKYHAKELGFRIDSTFLSKKLIDFDIYKFQLDNKNTIKKESIEEIDSLIISYVIKRLVSSQSQVVPEIK